MKTVTKSIKKTDRLAADDRILVIKLQLIDPKGDRK